MSAAEFLIDTSALVPLIGRDARAASWFGAAAAGLIAVLSDHWTRIFLQRWLGGRL